MVTDILHWDRDLFHLVNGGLHTPFLDGLWFKVTQSGDVGQVLVVIALLFYKPVRPVAWLGLASWCSSGLACLIFKAAINRQRPSWYAFAVRLDAPFNAPSFPSGHTTTTWGLAVALWLVTRKTKQAWLGIIAMVWACMVAYSRVYVGAHYPGDVLAGAALGSLFAALSFQLFVSKGWLGTSPSAQAD